MTASENFQMVMMLLDDSRATYAKDTEFNRAINEAQLRKLNEYYISQEERALRPLYRQTAFLDNDAEIIDADDRRLLYPRSCRIFKTTGQAEGKALMAEHINEDVYLNYVRSVHRELGGQNFPRSAYYTIIKDSVAVIGMGNPINRIRTKIRFTKGSSGNRAILWYIAYPKTYFWDVLQAGSVNIQNLELPEEYHIEVCTLAAEIINDMDVGELERGAIAFQNQRLNLEKVGG